VITTGEPGGFDEHSRKLTSPQLNDVRDQMIRIPGDVLNYHRDRLLGKEGAVLEAARKVFQTADVRPRYRVVDESGQDAVGVEIHVFRNGGATIVGMLTNPDLRVDELGPPEFKSNARFEKPRRLRLLLDAGAYVYDVRKGQFAGKQNQVEFTLDPYEPVVYALLPLAASDLHVAVPGEVALGSTAHVSISTDATAATSVFRVEVTDPGGNTAAHYSGNFFGAEGRGGIQIPFAVNDSVGKWVVSVRDVLTGKTERRTFEVQNAKSQF
jgi:hypothetical protein